MALFGDTKLVFCLFFIACCYLTGELTNKVVIVFVSSLILLFSSKGTFFQAFSEWKLQQDVGLKGRCATHVRGNKIPHSLFKFFSSADGFIVSEGLKFYAVPVMQVDSLWQS